MLSDDRKSSNGKLSALQFLVTLTRDVFEARTSTGSELLSYLTCLHTTSFIILNIVSLVKTISLKIWERPLQFRFKFVAQRRRLLKLSIAGDEGGPPVIWSKLSPGVVTYECRSCLSRYNLWYIVACTFSLIISYF